MDGSTEPSQLIELFPFIHQVGGHSIMFCLDDQTVCKPLIQRELEFYETLPLSVKKFVPTFHGMVKVHIVHDDEGFVKFLAEPPADYKPYCQTMKKVLFKKSGSIEILETFDLFVEEEMEDLDGSILKMNPWVLKCHKEKFASFEESTPKDFILLDNLTLNFTYPCIIDLKMGTRQYGDAASLAKKQSKMVKVVSTTSAKLGLRVGGMQVFQTQSKTFLCRNKYYGRQLSVAGFQQALFHFLHNGVRFRSDVLPVMIRKLEEFAAVLGQLEAIRLYTTSLLLIYDGEDHNVSDESIFVSADSKIGRQNSFKNCDSDLGRKTFSAESLSGYEDGLEAVPCENNRRRRASSATNLDSSTISEVSSNSSSNSTIFEEVASSGKPFREEGGLRSRSFSTKSDPGGPLPLEPRVDVKMIDFAHSTHRDLDDSVVYTGPDRGFIFGLEKLIGMLKTLETDYG